jgi:hypothetical protein
MNTIMLISNVEIKVAKDGRNYKKATLSNVPKEINGLKAIESLTDKTSTVIFFEKSPQGVINSNYERAVLGAPVVAQQFTVKTKPYNIVVEGKIREVSQYSGVQFAHEDIASAMSRSGFVVTPDGEFAKKVATVAAPAASASVVTEQVAA